MALLRTMWMARIMENLFAPNEFLNESLNWDEYANAGIKTVVIPQAGTPTGYERNRTIFPAPITERPDGDISYDMVDYTSNPQRVRDLEQLQMSYNKMQSVIFNMLMNIQDGVALDILYAWRAEIAARILQTSGAAKPTSLAGATGNRKLLTYNDLVDLHTAMDNDKIPAAGRRILLPSTMYNGMFLDADIKENFNSKLADLNKGILGEVLGFTIVKRAEVLRYTDAGVAKLPTAATVATDAKAGLAYHPAFVGKSKTVVNVLADAEPRPEHFGRIMSCELQAGGSKAYSDGRGAYAIVEAAA